MNELVVRTVAVGLLAAAGAAGAADVTFPWVNETTKNDPTNAVPWAVSENWDGDGYPQTASDKAKFANLTSGYKYVKLPDVLTVKEISGGTDKTYLLGKTVSFCALTYATYADETLRLYADKIIVPDGKAFDINTTSVAADMDLGTLGQMTFGGGAGRIYLNKYAVNDQPGRTNSIANFKTLLQGSGSPAWYPPAKMPERTLAWSQTANSPYLKCLTTIGTLTPGARVKSGAGVPEGTFLRRILENSWIELSQPVTETIVSNDIVFAAFEPKVYQHINKYTANSAVKTLLMINKTAAEDDFVMEIDEVSNSGSNFGFSGNVGKPAYLILHKITGGKVGPYNLGCVDIEFGARSDGGTPGFSEGAVRLGSADSAVTFIVPSELTAKIANLTNLVGSVTKRGAGALDVGLGFTAGATGKITVEAGTLILSNRADCAELDLAQLTIKAGATLMIKGRVQTKELVIEEGATLSGPGTLVLPNVAALPTVGTFTDGIQFEVTGQAGAAVLSRLAPQVVGNPAFWVDAQAADSFVADDSGVSRWNDCRGTEAQGYNFATNLYAKPRRITKTFGFNDGQNTSRPQSVKLPCVSIAADTAKTPEACQALVWGRKLTGIKSVFLVMDAKDGCGCVLGSTTFGAKGDADFPRGNVNWCELYYKPLTPDKVYNAPMYVNGVPVKPSFEPDAVGLYTDPYPFLYEVHPLADGAAADAFGLSGTRWDLCGGQNIYECIIYTNELTRAEQVAVADYLSRRWFSKPYAISLSADNRLASWPSDRGFGVSEGWVNVDTLTGSGAFTKTGAGQLVVQDCAGGADVSVQGGSLVLRSATAPAAADLPKSDRISLRLDANDLTGSTTGEEEGKGLCISKWKSLVGNVTASAGANHPQIMTVTDADDSRVKTGMKAVDFGPFYSAASGYGDLFYNGTARAMTMGVFGLRSFFIVFRGGNGLLGYSGQYSNLWAGGLYRGTTGLASDPLFNGANRDGEPKTGYAYPYLTTARINGVTVNPRKTGL